MSEELIKQDENQNNEEGLKKDYKSFSFEAMASEMPTKDEMNNLLQDAESAFEEGKAVEVTAEYKKFEDGEQVVCMFMGWKWIPSTHDATNNPFSDGSGRIAAAVFYSAEDGFFINANNVLVSTVADLPPKTKLAILCKGETKGKTNSYMDFSLSVITGEPAKKKSKK